ncbi:uncharacterized protein J7T54_007912 [Emericellopsis cladophorae]|uniref:Uncharacterized protein n=1 Tax=Emericellopsis cladophorae TaxID=2686198 RepID=A0A9Q0BHU7_9HYPO|nr:uncharacterized protein J7T54_007912 [Emericellopsis cladophorae]KAI6784819.1 hypothetical protein J7T54_007912 [Emericellopsis cladophorae]
MSLHTEIHVPGAFCPDGVHPGIFRPPTTTTPNTASAASSGYLPPRDINPNNHYGSIKRKRNHDREPDPFARSRAPATTTRYNIAGQLDTPGGERADFLGESMFSDADYRRMLGTKLPAGQVEEPVFGRYPLTAPAQPQQSWGAFAVSTLGGVVGKLWQFCRAGSFTGFHAGGGRGYDQDGNTEDDHDMAMNGSAQIPEQYTYYNLGEEQEDATANSRASTPTRPAAKRRQTSVPDELGKNWVMVNENGAAYASPKTIYRPSQAITGVSAIFQQRPANIFSVVCFSEIAKPNEADHCGHTVIVITGEAATVTSTSTLHLRLRFAREEQFNDFRVTGLNKTVEDLIRQGQMALATKVEVEGSGWEDDD